MVSAACGHDETESSGNLVCLPSASLSRRVEFDRVAVGIGHIREQFLRLMLACPQQTLSSRLDLLDGAIHLGRIEEPEPEV